MLIPETGQGTQAGDRIRKKGKNLVSVKPFIRLERYIYSRRAQGKEPFHCPVHVIDFLEDGSCIFAKRRSR